MKENLPPATIIGTAGQAWAVDLDAIRATAKRTEDGGVAEWVIEATWAHPLWHSYLIMLLHLREFKGQPRPPVIYLEGATHEIILFALNPEKPRTVHKHPEWLEPANFSAHFIEPSDAAAKARVEKDIHDICDGVLSPDTDYTQHWIARYNASMIRGNPKRAGETKIIVAKPDGTRVEIVHDPKGFDKKPDIK